jgi:iron complex outermembrane recepter protein
MSGNAKRHSAKSRTQRGVRIAQLTVSVTCLCGLVDAVAAASADKVGAVRNNVEEVIVTAQRRAENLQDVPISITALSGEQLDVSSQSVNQELERVPGVAVIDSQFGGSLMTIRGVASTEPFFGGTNTAGYYLDSVPFGFVRSSFSPNASAYDLERVEVLRGPQGTLYGVTAQSGVVRVLTHAADLDEFDLKFRTYASTTTDGGTNGRGDIAVNTPIVTDKLAARFVYGYEDLSGWIDNPTERDVNDSQTTTGRIRIDAALTDRLTLGAMYWRNVEKRAAHNNATDDRTTGVTMPEPSNIKYDIYSVTGNYNFGGFTLTSATSLLDYDLKGQDFLGGTFVLTQYFTSEVFTEEVSLSSTDQGVWRWSIGGIYRRTDDLYAQNVVSNGVGILPNPDGLAANDYSRSHAIFGEVTRSLFDDHLEITAGLRHFEDEVTYKERRNAFDLIAPLVSRTFKFNATSPRFVVTWLPTESFTAYASYAEGFRSGFSQNSSALAVDPTLPPTDADNLVTYEIGAKGRLWSGFADYEVAVYHNDWEDIQQRITIATPLVSTGVAAVINGESASGVGADLGVTLHPLSNLHFSATYSWNDLAFDEDVISGGVIIARAGDRLTNSPKSTGSLAGDYDFALGGGYTAHISAGVSNTAGRNSRVLVNNSLVQLTGDDVTTVQARLSVEAPAGWTLSLFGENLNDYNDTAVPVLTAPAAGTYRIRPRTIGLQLDARF